MHTLPGVHSIFNTSIPLLEQRLRNRNIESPFHVLNKISLDSIPTHVSYFEKELKRSIASFEEFGGRNVNEVKLTDYLNPQIKDAAVIISLIELQKYPPAILEHFLLKSEQDLLTFVFTRMFYKTYLDYSIINTPDLKSLVDISNPAEWYPEARKMKRKIIMHVGPTNSGKTYTSLQKLKQAKSGYYAGPLRLLAREIYEKFNEDGHRCNLITGEEVIPMIDEFGKVSEVSSGTIEMIPLNKKMEVCIIDEIQMISDDRRGAVWTSAVLGVLAKEVHLCGEASAVPLIKKLCKVTGDELIIHNYERMGKLTVLTKPLHSLNNLKKGDALIAFSKRKILELKCKIEQTTDLKVGIIYGALPPEIRSQEANGFNSGEYDVLVASDAIGMGLNLRIKRIIFERVKKFDGNNTVPLTASAVKQIAGRAGRFSKDRGELEGFVTTLYKNDLKFVKERLMSPIVDLEKACIWPTDHIWKHYLSEADSDVPFHKRLAMFMDDTQDLDMKNYFVSDMTDRLEILKLFLRDNLYKRTPIEDQLRLSLAPINCNMASPAVIECAFKFFTSVTERTTKTIFDFGFLHEELLLSNPKIVSTERVVETLVLLEDCHKLVLLFMWLSQRWPTLFIDKESAMDVKSLIEKRISQELGNLRKMNKS